MVNEARGTIARGLTRSQQNWAAGPTSHTRTGGAVPPGDAARGLPPPAAAAPPPSPSASPASGSSCTEPHERDVAVAGEAAEEDDSEQGRPARRGRGFRTRDASQARSEETLLLTEGPRGGSAAAEAPARSSPRRPRFFPGKPPAPARDEAGRLAEEGPAGGALCWSGPPAASSHCRMRREMDMRRGYTTITGARLEQGPAVYEHGQGGSPSKKLEEINQTTIKNILHIATTATGFTDCSLPTLLHQPPCRAACRK